MSHVRYSPIDPDLFILNRRRFVEKLPAGALCVFHSNDVFPANADGSLPFVQNSNLFWLTGIDQEETVCLLFPDAPNSEDREILFIRKTNEHIATWEGHKYSKEEARKISGIDHVRWLSSFKPMLKKLMSETDLVFLTTPNNAKQDLEIRDRNTRFALWCQETFPLHRYRNASPLIHDLRMIKSPAEIALIRHACNITGEAFRRVLKVVRPGIHEYEIEAEYAHGFISNRARFAYDPIVAAGENSCVLHYVQNNRKCEDGQIVLMDVGASYANYASDMTRTVPVNGRFTTRQRKVYDAVLCCLQEARNLLKPGVLPEKYDKAVEIIVEKELVDLGLISMQELKTQDPDRPLLRKYFMHRTSHSLGLDVHDAGDRHRPLEAGMVLTCEPGIYIRSEGIGVRLENDILITEDGYEDLMADIPIAAEEIEDLMHAQ